VLWRASQLARRVHRADAELTAAESALLTGLAAGVDGSAALSSFRTTRDCEQKEHADKK
jgi:hypothetical protein